MAFPMEKLRDIYDDYKLGHYQKLTKDLVAPGIAEPRHFHYKIFLRDFAAVDGGEYTIHCSGNKVTWDDVKLFRPILELDRPFEGGEYMAVGIRVRKEKALWPDQTIGRVTAFIMRGQSEPDPETGLYGRIGNGEAPTNAPPPGGLKNGFYLCCTKKCKVKGSEGKDGSSATIHLDIEGWSYYGYDPGVILSSEYGRQSSASHEVKCVG